MVKREFEIWISICNSFVIGRWGGPISLVSCWETHIGKAEKKELVEKKNMQVEGLFEIDPHDTFHYSNMVQEIWVHLAKKKKFEFNSIG